MIANLELYHVFYWTARELNFSRAAERLYITQPSVSHSIKQLENELNVTLFHRVAKGVKLTDEGILLYSQVKSAFYFLESGERQIAELNNLTHGELRFGSSDSLCKHYLLPHLGVFCNDYPKILLDVMHGTTPEIIRNVKNGRIDFGIIRLPYQDDSLTILETITVQDCFVVGPRYFELAQKEIPLNKLKDYPIILFSKRSSSREFIQEFAKAGLGISFVTKQFVQSELDNGLLKEVKLTETIPTRKIGVIFQKNRFLTPATKVFLHEYLGV
nr:LysR family transcriptional regulator [Paenibacillus bovis]